MSARLPAVDLDEFVAHLGPAPTSLQPAPPVGPLPADADEAVAVVRAERAGWMAVVNRHRRARGLDPVDLDEVA